MDFQTLLDNEILQDFFSDSCKTFLIQWQLFPTHRYYFHNTNYDVVRTTCVEPSEVLQATTWASLVDKVGGGTKWHISMQLHSICKQRAPPVWPRTQCTGHTSVSWGITVLCLNRLYFLFWIIICWFCYYNIKKVIARQAACRSRACKEMGGAFNTGNIYCLRN